VGSRKKLQGQLFKFRVVPCLIAKSCYQGQAVEAGTRSKGRLHFSVGRELIEGVHFLIHFISPDSRSKILKEFMMLDEEGIVIPKFYDREILRALSFEAFMGS